MSQSTQLIAFYLPQFHPIPENDAWWGKGFTEWTNVARAKPVFRGHQQPHLPADLGFYDLRLPEARQEQAKLAAEYGVGGFCYYHYWFNGRRVLERPFNEVLASGQPELPFCLCWANEDWTRAWDGRSRDVLLRQVYSPEDDEAHLRSLLPAFKDPRYIRKDGKPLFLIYRAARLPDPAATLRRWRQLAEANGLPGLYLLRVESFPDETGDPRALGFDAAVDFQPEWRAFPESKLRHFLRRVVRKYQLTAFGRLRHGIHRYDQVVRLALSRPTPAYLRYPGVTPSWDNSARRAWGALIIEGSTPAAYGAWLREVVRREKPEFLFINAWNEWAEGNHLEPCTRWGRGYLEATRAAMAE